MLNCPRTIQSLVPAWILTPQHNVSNTTIYRYSPTEDVSPGPRYSPTDTIQSTSPAALSSARYSPTDTIQSTSPAAASSARYSPTDTIQSTSPQIPR